MERFSASSASRHMACPASANLELAIPAWTPPVVDPTAGAKGRGTAMHKVMEELVGLPSRTLLQLSAVLEYVAEVKQRRRFSVLSEHTMEAAWLTVPTHTTADLVLYVKDEMHIFDFKWGAIPVELVGNKQLLFYAATYAGFAPKAKEVTLHLVQPSAGIFDAWVVDTTELAQFMDDARAAEQRILRGDTTFGPSDSCTFCPANPQSRSDKGRPFCPAMMQIHYPAPFDEDEILTS